MGKLNNICTQVQYCVKSDYKFDCGECDDGYFVNNNNCVSDSIQGDTYKNYKVVYYNQDHCSKCKSNYNLKEEDNFVTAKKKIIINAQKFK